MLKLAAELVEPVRVRDRFDDRRALIAERERDAVLLKSELQAAVRLNRADRFRHEPQAPGLFFRVAVARRRSPRLRPVWRASGAEQRHPALSLRSRLPPLQRST
jgi:hypothetical protein